MWSCPPSSRIPSPSRHSGSLTRHSGASRNLWRTVIFTVIPTPPAVIPAQAGIYGVRSYSPSSRLPQPSFRRKPESMAYGHIHHHSGSPPPPVIPAQAGIYRVRSYSPSYRIPSPSRHSGASRNLWRTVIFTIIPDPLPHPSFRRKPESIACGHIHRHTGSPPPAVIPAQAGIYACRPLQPSYRRKPESILAASPNRHSVASPNLSLPPPPAVIPAQAGMTVVGASQC